MKATAAKDLIVGRVYSDISQLREISALLRFKFSEGDISVFEYVGGHKTYPPSVDGLIRLGCRVFYGEVFEEELKQYLPETK